MLEADQPNSVSFWCAGVGACAQSALIPLHYHANSGAAAAAPLASTAQTTSELPAASRGVTHGVAGSGAANAGRHVSQGPVSIVQQKLSLETDEVTMTGAPTPPATALLGCARQRCCMRHSQIWLRALRDWMW